MKLARNQRLLVLLVGDLACFLIALWAALALRYFEWPSVGLVLLHLRPFAFLFVVSIAIFYVAGLYGRQTVILRSRLPYLLANAQLGNVAIAVLFFYLIPFFGITPKTVLFVYLLMATGLVLVWRLYGYELLPKAPMVKALLIGSGEEMRALFDEVNGTPAYGITFVSSIDLGTGGETAFWDEIVSRIYTEKVSFIALDLMHSRVGPILPRLYNLIFAGVTFVDMHVLYEDVFDRVPLSLLRYNWFIENISATPRALYDSLKRLMDLVLSLVLGVTSLIIYPLVILAIKFDDGGPVFISQERVGQNNKPIRIQKFRTMTGSDQGEYGTSGVSELRVTRVGKFLRDSRIDELPQLWSVFLGDQSLVGPRPELPSLAKVYEEEIPYYSVRHILKPGLSGWAQISQENHPHHGTAVVETKEKLSYDLYYLKNRSFLLDIQIALKTVKTLLSRVGK